MSAEGIGKPWTITQDTMELTVHPGQLLTDELAIAISTPWLSSYLATPGGMTRRPRRTGITQAPPGTGWPLSAVEDGQGVPEEALGVGDDVDFRDLAARDGEAMPCSPGVQNTHPGMIRLEGDTASGRAYISELIRFRDGRSDLNYAIYHDRYRRTQDAQAAGGSR